MAENSKIEWTDFTWQATHGCSVVSPGCTNCYAMKMAARLDAMGLPAYAGLTQQSKAGPVWNGTMRAASDKALMQPLSWKKPRRIFVNSMSDLFAEGVEDDWIDRAFAVMAMCPQHTFQVLTKRPDRMRTFLTDSKARGFNMCDAAIRMVGADTLEPPADWPLPNVWLGTSVEDQPRAEARIPHLLATPAAVRFLSCEPLLGPVNVKSVRFGHMSALSRLDWIIAGGESGSNARPWSIQWARALRDQCVSADVPFFWKQNGEWRPAGSQPSETPGHFAFGDYEHDPALMMRTDHYPRAFTMFGARSVMERVGKKTAGAMLDGREWRELPR